MMVITSKEDINVRVLMVLSKWIMKWRCNNKPCTYERDVSLGGEGAKITGFFLSCILEFAGADRAELGEP